MRIAGPGRALFALAGAGLAVLILVYRDFAPMWQAIPPSIPGRATCIYGSGSLLLAAAAGLCFARTALPGALTIGAYLAVWAATSLAPIASKPLSVGSWYGFCEALTPVIGAWILYATLRRQRATPQGSPIARERALRLAQTLFGLDCIVYGLAHFAYLGITVSMVPAWLPDRTGFAYLTGLCHIAAGIGIVAGILPWLAATLEAAMMSSFGLLVWLPSLWASPRPAWATPPRNQWSEIVVTLLLASSAWILAASLRDRPWGGRVPA